MGFEMVDIHAYEQQRLLSFNLWACEAHKPAMEPGTLKNDDRTFGFGVSHCWINLIGTISQTDQMEFEVTRLLLHFC